MHWLRRFHWCLVRLEKESSGRKRVLRRPTELDASVFQLALENGVDGQLTDGMLSYLSRLSSQSVVFTVRFGRFRVTLTFEGFFFLFCVWWMDADHT